MGRRALRNEGRGDGPENRALCCAWGVPPNLHNIGHISCIDVIDFDYLPWHTQGDTPGKCSALSLAKVGWVLKEWLKTAK